MHENSEDIQLKLTRKYLKMKIMENDLTFRGHEQQRAHVYDLLLRTVEAGESNSALVIGPRGSGKTTLMSSVLHDLKSVPGFEEDSIVVKLNGLIHTDDKLALKAITSQMFLDNAIGDRVFGSFSENLAFLLSCLRSGQDRHCKSVLFFLDEFDIFCHSHSSQTLLYNLFDIAQSRQAPISVIGITCRLDVIELLEKRVKSRFSHRQIFIFPNSQSTEGENPIKNRMELFVELLSLPSEVTNPTRNKKKTKQKNLCDILIDSDDSDSLSSEYEGKNKTDGRIRRGSQSSLVKEILKTPKKNERPEKIKSVRKCLGFFGDSDIEKEINESDKENESLNQYEMPHSVLEKCHSSWKEFSRLDPIFVSFWNENIKNIAEEDQVRNYFQALYDIDVNEWSFRNLLFQLICKLSTKHPQLETSDLIQVCQNVLNVDEKVQILLSLSILELSLVIAMKHQMEIFDNQPMNFEMVLNRYTKFANSNSSSQSVPRAVILKAFEHLRSMELITPMKCDTSSNFQLQKEYQLYRPSVTPCQLMAAIKVYKALPTELAQWASSSLI